VATVQGCSLTPDIIIIIIITTTTTTTIIVHLIRTVLDEYAAVLE
jgi:hypothetical protein